jgi:hypothetical protein
MRTTDKVDINGNEIYEGSLVKDSCGTYEVRWSEERKAFIIADDETEYYDKLSKQGKLEVVDKRGSYEDYFYL